jgi:hypothetical protein
VRLGAALAAALVATASPGRAAEQSCLEELGRARADVLVDQCLTVSPATHPPCNSDNPCAMIIEEIARGCAMITEAGEEAPEFCADAPEEGDNEEPDAPAD